MFFDLRCFTADYLNRIGHAYISVADRCAPSASDTGHGQFTLYEVMGEFSEKTAVAAIMHSRTGVVSTRHARETRKGAGIPHTDALDNAWFNLAVCYGKTCTRWTDVGATPALKTPVPDGLPSLVCYLARRYISRCAGKPCVGIPEVPSYMRKDVPPPFDVGFISFLKNFIFKN
jgi:hypothetical protein